MDQDSQTACQKEASSKKEVPLYREMKISHG